MIEDEVLKIRFRLGSRAALERIYDKYQNDLLTLAMALVNHSHTAEDVLHDVFVRLAGSRHTFQVRGNLKSFLVTCVLNRTRDVLRRHKHRDAFSPEEASTDAGQTDPLEDVMCDEQSRQVNQALETLPYEQREAVVLHLKADLPFKEIARMQEVPVRTAQGRCRYGLEKLQSMLIRETVP